MANRVYNVLSGVGSVDDVVSRLKEQFTCGSTVAAVHAAGATMRHLMSLSPESRRAALAICCAVLNTDYAKSGELHAVNESGWVQSRYESEGPWRDIIAALLAD